MEPVYAWRHEKSTTESPFPGGPSGQALFRMFGAEKLKKSAAKTVTYKDAGRISAGARSMVSLMAGIGLFNGFADSGSFSPGEGMTVGQAAVMTENVIVDLINR